MELVHVGAARASIGDARLRYVGAPWGWAGLWPRGDAQIPIRVNGSEAVPDAALVELAEVVLPNLDAIEAASNTYLRWLVAYVEDLYIGDWQLSSVEIGWGYPSSHEAGTVFDVTLAIRGDEYGQWRVGFQREKRPRDVLHPYFFARRQG